MSNLNSKVSISIAMATYNGSKYLQEQLNSILDQTVLPDELIVCDDGSSDETVAILNHFALVAPFGVRVFTNDQNLGSSKNFEQSICLCTGDVIFLCDQDDVWKPNKIETMSRYLLESREVGLVFSDAAVVDDNLNELGFSLWESLEFTKRDQERVNAGGAFAFLLKRNVVTGATCAFRREILDYITPISRLWIHDGWLAILVASFFRVQVIEQKLIDYRQHSNQQVGAVNRTLLQKLRYQLSSENRKQYIELEFDEPLRRFSALLDHHTLLERAKPEHVMLLQEKRSHLQRRKDGHFLLEWKLGGYHRFARGPRTMLRDLIHSIGLSF